MGYNCLMHKAGSNESLDISRCKYNICTGSSIERGTAAGPALGPIANALNDLMVLVGNLQGLSM